MLDHEKTEKKEEKRLEKLLRRNVLAYFEEIKREKGRSYVIFAGEMWFSPEKLVSFLLRERERFGDSFLSGSFSRRKRRKASSSH